MLTLHQQASILLIIKIREGGGAGASAAPAEAHHRLATARSGKVDLFPSYFPPICQAPVLDRFKITLSYSFVKRCVRKIVTAVHAHGG